MKIDLKNWIPIMVTLITLIVGVGIAYGQLTTKIDTLQSQVKSIEIEKKSQTKTTDSKIHTTNETVQDMKVKQARLETMVELLLSNEGIAVPVNQDN